MIGIDIVSIKRISASIDRWGEKFLQKFLTQEEISSLKTNKSAAGYWAAKEACSKALGCGICPSLAFHDMLICKTSNGAPFIELSNKTKFSNKHVNISITHDGDYAVAVAFWENK